MVLKIVVLSAILALSSASVAPQAVAVPAAPAAVLPAPVFARISDDTIDPNPSYSFAYDVQDALTGDSKGHIESRANGIVQGQYNVAESDGTRRIVDYTADPVNGFNALVRKVPLVAAAPVVAARAGPIVAAAPVVAARAAPVVAAAPVATAPVVAARAAPLVAQRAPLVAQTARLAAQPAPVVAARSTLAAPLVTQPAPLVAQSAPLIAQSAPFLAARSFGVLPAASYVSAPFQYAYI